MKKSSIVLLIVIIGLLITATDCKKKDEGKGGCMDIMSDNYNPEATWDDGSCDDYCETLNTAFVWFRNASQTNRSYDIIWDGYKLTTIDPDEKSEKFTVAPNIQHTCVFKIKDTDTIACTEAHPILVKCEKMTLVCDH